MRKLYLTLAVFAALFGLINPAVHGALVIRSLGGMHLDANASNEFVLDVDQNGQPDFNFQTFFSNDAAFILGFDQVKVPFGSPNGLVIRAATTDGFPSASFLIPGNVVGPGNIFSAGSSDTTNLYSSDPLMGATGEFGGARGGLGFRFDSNGAFRYGFADIAVNDLNSSTPFNVTLYSVSYDDAGAAITVVGIPEPTSAGLVGIVMLATLVNRRHRKPATRSAVKKFDVE